MTALVLPTFERRLLQAVGEQMASEPVRNWPEPSQQLCLRLVEALRANTARKNQTLERLLTEGVEARSFARENGPLLPATDEQLTQVRGIIERLAPGEDPGAETVAAELHVLERELQAFRDLLAEALSRASETPRPVDPARVRAAEEAYAHGDTKRFCPRSSLR